MEKVQKVRMRNICAASTYKTAVLARKGLLCPQKSHPSILFSQFLILIYITAAARLLFFTLLVVFTLFPTNHQEVLHLQGRKPQQFFSKKHKIAYVKMPPHRYMTASLLNMFHSAFWSINFNVLITGLVNLVVNTFRKAPSTYLFYQCDLGNIC